MGGLDAILCHDEHVAWRALDNPLGHRPEQRARDEVAPLAPDDHELRAELTSAGDRTSAATLTDTHSNSFDAQAAGPSRSFAIR